MKRPLLLTLSLLILMLIGQKLKAQDSLKVNAAVDTTIYDDKAATEGYFLMLPQSTLSQQDYNLFIHNQFSASPIIKKNRLYTKLEISMLVEKDGSVSKYEVKGTGTQLMRNEMVRILKLLPKYTPGTRDGQKVRVKLHQPFEFKYE
ncbi:energy transducer TonB [Pedobacter kyungheensis]|nr:energy transducer TonB [Pedobacter kyungheensis]